MTMQWSQTLQLSTPVDRAWKTPGSGLRHRSFFVRQTRTAARYPVPKKPASKAAKPMTDKQKYEALKRQTEEAGMTVREVAGQLVVSRPKKRK